MFVLANASMFVVTSALECSTSATVFFISSMVAKLLSTVDFIASISFAFAKSPSTRASRSSATKADELSSAAFAASTAPATTLSCSETVSFNWIKAAFEFSTSLRASSTLLAVLETSVLRTFWASSIRRSVSVNLSSRLFRLSSICLLIASTASCEALVSISSSSSCPNSEEVIFPVRKDRTSFVIASVPKLELGWLNIPRLFAARTQ